MSKPPPPPYRWPNYELEEPSSRRIEPRKAALLSIKSMRGISMVIVAIGLLAVFFSSSRLDRLAREGQVVPATSVDVLDSHNPKRPREIRIEYRYRYNGFEYREERGIDKMRYEALAKGPSFPITVLPSDPYVHEVGPVGEREVAGARTEGSLIVFGIAAPFALLAIGIRLQIRRETKELRTWHPLPAQVIEIEQTNPNGVELFAVGYRVRLPNGKAIERHITLDGTQAKRLRVGAFFPVLAPPEKLSRHSRMKLLSSFTMTRLETGPTTAGTLSP